MKRFYCTDCKKVKRVRRLPQLPSTAYYHVDGSVEKVLSDKLQDRLGLCHFHTKMRSRRDVNNRLRITGQRKRGGK